MPIVNEGETGEAQGFKNLIYPNISSCLTMTCVCAGGIVIGGHAVVIPEQGQLSISKMVDELKMRKLTVRRLYLIGDLGIWDQNVAAVSNNRFTDVDAIAAELVPDNKTPIVKVDVDKFTNGVGAVQIVVHPATTSVRVLANNGVGDPHWDQRW